MEKTIAAPRQQLATELLHRLSAALRSAQLYSAGHPIISRNLEGLSTAIQLLHATERAIVIGIVGSEIVVDEAPIADAEVLGGLVRRFQQLGVERVTIERGMTSDELATFIHAVANLEGRVGDERLPFPALPHIHVGRITVQQRQPGSVADMAAARQMYADAVTVAEDLWEGAQTEGTPDATLARRMIDGLAQAVARNRTALLALTTLKNYDNYTFTHMVNVSILTMGQARGLGVDGPLLREFGLAALMHDIGKVRTPLEILNKPERLTEAEFVIMRRHTVDGAEILRKTPEIPTLAPVVAFEHHLRLDGSGYPAVSRPSLNLGTMMCSIADVYDAMRSQRKYQQAFPSDRILGVMKHKDGRHFDQNLLRRFVQLLGIYPAGSLVRLDTGEAALVLQVHAPDPYRPRVRVLFDRTGRRLDLAYDINLWEAAAQEAAAKEAAAQPGPASDSDVGTHARASSIVAPLEPADYQIDPLALM